MLVKVPVLVRAVLAPIGQGVGVGEIRDEGRSGSKEPGACFDSEVTRCRRLHPTRRCAISASGTPYSKFEPNSKPELMVINLTRNKGRHWSWLAAGWCALLLYAGACSPLGMGLAALAGALDPNHQLLTAASERSVRLVLHHGSRCASHHHGLAARALTLFAQPASPANPDHILQFSSADTLNGQSQTSAPQADSSCVLLVFHGGEFLSHTPKVLAAGVSPDSSPQVDAARLCLRSTVLLI